MLNTKETNALWNYSSGARGIVPILRRHGLHNHIDELLAAQAKFAHVVRCLRDVEKLEETGCLCGELTGKRTSQPLCEGCRVAKVARVHGSVHA